MATSPLRVCLDARLIGGMSGGSEQVVIGLASSFSQLADGDEEYLFLVYSDAYDWLKPYVKGRCQLLVGPPAPSIMTGPIAPIRAVLRTLRFSLSSRLRAARRMQSPRLNGILEDAGVSVIHFVTQGGFPSHIPSIYQVHDLQYLHLPRNFNLIERMTRDSAGRALCRQSQAVTVMTSWVKQDVVRRYEVPYNKVFVVPLASPLSAYRNLSDLDVDAVRRKYSLPDRFIYYPAQTYPHKNHLGLLAALAILRDSHHLAIPLVCSGRLSAHLATIMRRVHDLGLDSQVAFLGYVDATAVVGIYDLCSLLVFPTRFEGFGLPIAEAFQAEVPVACSDISPLIELAGGAALTFNPDRPEEIAEAIRRLWTDDDLCQALVARGRERLSLLSWERTARTFRALYRRVAGRMLAEADRTLLEAPPHF